MKRKPLRWAASMRVTFASIQSFGIQHRRQEAFDDS